MIKTETTNGLLNQVLEEIDTLIIWAKADAEHASENDAPETAKDDLQRATNLTEARRLIDDCRR